MNDEAYYDLRVSPLEEDGSTCCVKGVFVDGEFFQ
jgi:hypothetical protein